jgi:hypothetical protein
MGSAVSVTAVGTRYAVRHVLSAVHEAIAGLPVGLMFTRPCPCSSALWTLMVRWPLKYMSTVVLFPPPTVGEQEGFEPEHACPHSKVLPASGCAVSGMADGLGSGSHQEQVRSFDPTGISQVESTGAPTATEPPGKFGSLWRLSTSSDIFANRAPTEWFESMMIVQFGVEPQVLPSPSQPTRNELPNGFEFRVTLEFLGKMPQQPVHPKNVSLRQWTKSGVLVTNPGEGV